MFKYNIYLCCNNTIWLLSVSKKRKQNITHFSFVSGSQKVAVPIKSYIILNINPVC